MIYENIKLSEWNEAVYMTAYVPFEDDGSGDVLRDAVIICPGGGYLGFNAKETESVALQFMANGTCAFVLNYSIGAGVATLPAPIVDMANAVNAVRMNSRRYAIDPQRIHVMGFSTSAQCVALFGSVWHESWLSDLTGMAAEKMMPNAIILGYPILDAIAFQSMITVKRPEYAVMAEMMVRTLYNTPAPTPEVSNAWNLALHLTEKTVATWIWTLEGDELVDVKQVECFVNQLRRIGVDCQMNMYKPAPHGSGLGFNNDQKSRNDWFKKYACIGAKPVLY